MNKIILLLPFLCFSCNNHINASDLYIFSENGKYGYFNDEREVIIEPIYTQVTNFQSENAIVQIGFPLSGKNQYAVIDKLGNILFKFESEDSDIPIISDERVRFKRDGKYGFLNLTGEEIIFGYERANDFSEGFAVVKDRSIAPNRFLININGIPLRKDGKIVNFFSIQDFHEGLAKVSEYNANEDKILHGFIDQKGIIKIPIEYTALDSRYYEGYCIASMNNEINGSLDLKAFGVINRENEWVIPPIHYEIRPFNGKYFAVRYGKSEPKKAIREKWKLIDEKGRNHLFFDESIIIRGGVENGKYTYTNKELYAGDEIGFINQEGEIITAINIKRLDFFVKKYCPVIKDNENAILFEDGTVVVNNDFFKTN